MNELAGSRSAKLIVYWTLIFHSTKRTYPMEEGGANSRREAWPRKCSFRPPFPQTYSPISDFICKKCFILSHIFIYGQQRLEVSIDSESISYLLVWDDIYNYIKDIKILSDTCLCFSISAVFNSGLEIKQAMTSKDKYNIYFS